MSVALSVNNLEKNYGDFKALKGISFEVNEGEIFGLLGANGAGKSTTLECIEGVKSFQSGNIEVFGQSISKSSDYNKFIGVQLQSTSLQNNITVLEAMKFFCKWQKIEVRTDLLDEFGLKQQYKKQYSSLSTGQKRRLHLALAIANNPKILILDEPTAGLDVEGRVSLHNEIRRLKANGVTIILASHDMAEVELLCDRIAIIVNGEIRVMGTARDIISEGDKDKKILVKTLNNSLLNHARFTQSKITEKSESYITLLSTDIAESLSEIISLVKGSKDVIVDLKVEGLSLEERFIEVINTKGEVS